MRGMEVRLFGNFKRVLQGTAISVRWKGPIRRFLVINKKPVPIKRQEPAVGESLVMGGCVQSCYFGRQVTLRPVPPLGLHSGTMLTSRPIALRPQRLR